ncbi:MAG TPA: UdgX family uracil-DNA binding protein [Thermomicrobiales bacterium]|nr:UdgX family uracil-DNA binding protein [Thermomicrobiales bacterium]
MPRGDTALNHLRAEAASCTRCPLHEIGTQTVFGAGPASARLMFVGEAPGAQEDATGQPFVGPAGKVFDEAIAAAGIDRASVYVTNAVKHRPWKRSESGRQKNRAPKQSEIKACAIWLDGEIEIIQPQLICCLGAVAAKRLLGKDFRLMEQRGQWFSSDDGRDVLATVHPSFVQIQRPEARERWMSTFVDDLRAVKQRLDDAH